ncbi:YdcF family protein [Cytobacillus sp. Hz8]|uniref:YdcF family protein n=1 Tax=Cytobacillus sp. Hz8 TaxID=3347168 RepID=UPI0035D5ACA0
MKKTIRVLFAVLGALSIIYATVSLGKSRLNTGVLAFFVVGGLFVIAAAFYPAIFQFFHKRKKLKITVLTLISIGLICSVVLESFILFGIKDQHPKQVDAIVVLGAGVREGTPSPVLKLRLKKTVEVHRKYKNAMIYVTGGLDTGEEKTEAKVMKEYLVEHGVKSNLIVMEDKATSTEENFKFTKKMMSPIQRKIMVVTSDFHMYRAKYYAKKVGFDPYSASSGIQLSIVPLTHIREILAIGYMLARDGL